MAEETAVQHMARKLREARQYIGLSIEDVAKKYGVKPHIMEAMEAGRVLPTDYGFRCLARIYGKPIDHFLGQELPPAQEPFPHHNLSAEDREELNRFADYLHWRSIARNEQSSGKE